MNKISEIKELYMSGINHIGQIENNVKNKKETIIARSEKISSITSKVDVIIDLVKGVKGTELSKINAYSKNINDNYAKQVKQDVKRMLNY